jgi:hypothetical protein
MKFFHVGRLTQTAIGRKPGYMAALQKVGKPMTRFGMPFLAVSDTDAAALRKEFALEQPSPVVPCGFQTQYTKEGRPILLGDLVSKFATPIARLARMNCIDKTTGQLKPESGCAQRRDRLNRLKLS